MDNFLVGNRVTPRYQVAKPRYGTVIETEYREKDLQVKVRWDDAHVIWVNHDALVLCSNIKPAAK